MLEDANRAIWEGYRLAARLRAGQDRYSALIRAIDDLLFELEELNLAGVDRVPAVVRDRAGVLLSLTPCPDAAELPVRYRVIPLMDVLFQAQEYVFRAKDPGRPPVSDDEEDLRSA